MKLEYRTRILVSNLMRQQILIVMSYCSSVCMFQIIWIYQLNFQYRRGRYYQSLAERLSQKSAGGRGVPECQ